MRILLLMESEQSYNILCSRFKGHKITPHITDDRLFRETLTKCQPHAAVVDISILWSDTARQQLVQSGVYVIPFAGDYSFVIKQIEKYASENDFIEELDQPKEEEPTSAVIAAAANESNLSGIETNTAATPVMNASDNEDQVEALEDQDFSEKPAKKWALRVPRFEDEDDELGDIVLPYARQPKVVEKIIGNVVVGVAGCGRRTGSTYQALKLAFFLAKHKGEKVAFVELVDRDVTPPVLKRLYDRQGDEFLEEGGFKYNGIDHYWDCDMTKLMKIYAKNYKYLILDMGQVATIENKQVRTSIYGSEYARADVQVLTCGSSIWDTRDLSKTLGAFNSMRWEKEIQIIVSYSNEATFGETRDVFSKKDRQKHKIQFHQAIFEPEVKVLNKMSVTLYEKILASVLPRQESRRKGLWPFGH